MCSASPDPSSHSPPPRYQDLIENLLRMFTILWNMVLQSDTARYFDQMLSEQPEHYLQGLHNLYNQRSDAKMLEANRSFLKSLESLRDTNQNYLNNTQPASAKSVTSPLPARPPTPLRQNSFPVPSQLTRHDEQEYDLVRDYDVERCTKKFDKLDLNSE
ncbi:unnamed protein product [Aureobasidium vineae]|uniref:Uncharacterized protein n=1 Tax=Aureobasidium vineae TaxID=2773715 RepID=A0A9N8JB91_9PEZI|nr:unnamed protein product [Aureobasidium vineae]